VVLWATTHPVNCNAAIAVRKYPTDFRALLRIGFRGSFTWYPWQCCLNNLDFLAGNNRVGWVDDDSIICFDSRHDLYLVAEIVPGVTAVSTTFPSFTIPTRNPSVRNSRVLTGTKKVEACVGTAKWTSA